MTTTTLSVRPRDDEIAFEVLTVTSTKPRPVSVQRSLPAETAARSLANLFSLPPDSPYALRDDASASYLVPDEPIGQQIEPGARVTVTTKSHLG